MSRNGSGVYSLPAVYEAVAGETILATQHNTPLEDIEADLNAARPVVAGGTGATSEIAAANGLEVVSFGAAQTITAADQAIARANISAALKGHIHGLTLSNNSTDGVNDIDIDAGEAASTETNPVLMVLASGLTKRLDASWSVGTNQGGLDTGSVATTAPYHVFLIQRSDTGVVDALFSLSATSPTMPADYDRKRRIGSLRRESSTIVAFRQTGDYFLRTPVSDRSSTAAASSVLVALSVPTGIRVRPIIRSVLQVSTSSSAVNALGDGDKATASYNYQQEAAGTVAVYDSLIVPPVFLTNTSAQVRFSATIGGGSILSNELQTQGWVDTRGRED